MPDEMDFSLAGRRVAVVGRLAGMSRRDAGRLLREQGAVLADRIDAATDLIVLGEHERADAGDWLSQLDEAARQAVTARGALVWNESQLWQHLGLVAVEPDVQRLYTPAMLAELLGVDVAAIRRWHRRGLIRPVCEVRRLAYFDFSEATAARRLAELAATGLGARSIEKQLAELAQQWPQVERPLVDLPWVVVGQKILLRQGDGLIEPGGQWRFDFDAEPAAPRAETMAALAPPIVGRALRPDASGAIALPADARRLCALAAELEDDGQLAEAAEMYRAAMAAGGSQPDLCFQLAELLYRAGDLPAARERYYMAIELDEDYVEARANLGCVLAELGQRDLAVAAFEGALKYHPHYADAHYHLARTLDELDRRNHSEDHWRAFLELAPDSPWADEARQRLTTAADRLF